MSLEPDRLPSTTNLMIFPAATWKSPDGARAAFGAAATWTDADVDRAAAGDGELGIYGGVRCVVLAEKSGKRKS